MRDERTNNHLPALALSSGLNSCSLDVPTHLVNSPVSKMNPGEISPGRDGPRVETDFNAPRSRAPCGKRATLRPLYSARRAAGKRVSQPRGRRPLACDSHLVTVVSFTPCCLSDAEINPTVTGVGITGSVSSSKTLPFPSKTPNQTREGRKKAEQSQRKGESPN